MSLQKRKRHQRYKQIRGHVRIKGGDGHLQTKERSLRRNQTYWHLALGLLASRTVRERISLFQLPILWYGSPGLLVHWCWTISTSGEPPADRWFSLCDTLSSPTHFPVTLPTSNSWTSSSGLQEKDSTVYTCQVNLNLIYKSNAFSKLFQKGLFSEIKLL